MSYVAALMGALITFAKRADPTQRLTPEEWAREVRWWLNSRAVEYSEK